MNNKKRLLPLGFIAVLCTIIVSSVANDPKGALAVVQKGWDHPTILARTLEDFLSENLPFGDELRAGVLRLRMAGGGLEQNGMFLADGGLIPNLTPASDATIHRNNTRQILKVSQTTSAPTCFMLLPTAPAIYEDRLPGYIPLYKQQSYIENTYKQFYGSAATVDAYNALLYADSDYLYYRTENNLTAMGGYNVYQALAPRLGFAARPLERFEVSYDIHDYYGSLYGEWGYGGVRPDTIATCRDTRSSAVSRVVRWERFAQRTYSTLYPKEAAASGDGMDIVLGGYAPRTEIHTEGARSGSLLVLGDRTAYSFLPFLTEHYKDITFLDLSLLTASEIGEFHPDDYSQVLFAYSMDTYLNSDSPAKAANLAQGPSEG